MSVAFIPLLSYSFINSVTPGPNNIMLATSGVNFGFKRTLPHFCGVYFGYLVMLGIVCFGLGEVFTRVPLLQSIMKYVGSGYLLYLAYRISQSSQISASNIAKPLSFIEAALFQYINPKAWVIAATIPASFVQGAGVTPEDILYLVGGHALVSFPAVILWVVAGTQLRRTLSSEKSLKMFNYLMAALLIGTVAMILTN
jgi:threonine/homoserine/homoserine lactone efflux protein